MLYDRKGDRHYDYISAWIKATRGWDPDASLYYLAVMLEGGEDPRFIVRRMVILASEDMGNADPAALGVAVAAAQAVEHVGMPEAKFALAQAAIYLSLAPKSNTAGRALGAAQRHVREHGAAPAPGWLRSGPRPGQEVGGYDNPHEHPGHVSPQELLPKEVAGTRFYEPDEAEAELAKRLEAGPQSARPLILMGTLRVPAALSRRTRARCKSQARQSRKSGDRDARGGAGRGAKSEEPSSDMRAGGCANCRGGPDNRRQMTSVPPETASTSAETAQPQTLHSRNPATGAVLGSVP